MRSFHVAGKSFVLETKDKKRHVVWGTEPVLTMWEPQGGSRALPTLPSSPPWSWTLSQSISPPETCVTLDDSSSILSVPALWLTLCWTLQACLPHPALCLRGAICFLPWMWPKGPPWGVPIRMEKLGVRHKDPTPRPLVSLHTRKLWLTVTN